MAQTISKKITHKSYYEDKSPFEPPKEITLKQAIALVFNILNVSLPNDTQTRYAEQTIRMAARDGKFHHLICDLSGLMGCFDVHCQKFYKVKGKL